MSYNYLTVKAGKKYRVIGKPSDWDGDYPSIGLVGVCKWTSSYNGASLEINGEDYLIPYDFIEEAKEEGIQDAILVTIMLDNPEGVLKILRGLWRMTKHITIRDLMERGILPEDLPNKNSEDYEKQWEQCLKQVKTTGDATLPVTVPKEGEVDWDEYARQSGMIISD